MDDITAFLMNQNREVAGNGAEGDEKLKKRWKEKAQIVSDRRWEGNKMQDDCVEGFLEISCVERVTLADRVGTLDVNLERKSKGWERKKK